MNGISKAIPAISKSGDFIVEFKIQHDAPWRPITVPPTYEPDHLHGKPCLLSDYVHASILADLHHKRTNQPTRVNARRLCYIHFKSHHLDPDTWHLYNPTGGFEDLQSAIKGCDDLMRTGHITETRVSFTQDTKSPGCYYPQGRATSFQIQLGEGANDGQRIQTDSDHPT